MHCVFHPLGIGSGRELRELLAIYHQAFPAEERQPDRILREDIRSGLAQAFVAKEAERVVFFLNVYPIPQSRLIFLHYAAVHPAYRGNHITRCFFNQAFALFGGDAILFGQQEDPDFGDNREERRKRIDYFRRMGFQYLKNAPYILPDHSGGTQLTRMVLCVMAQQPLSALPGNLIADAVKFIFTQVYRRGRDDALLMRNLNGIPDQIAVD